MARAYKRDNQGRFAGAGSGGKVTYGKAGGFANPAFRQRVAASRAAGNPGKGPVGQKASAGRSLGATAGTKGRSQKKTLRQKAGAFAKKNPQLTGTLAAYGAIAAVGAGGAAYSSGSRSIGLKAQANRAARAAGVKNAGTRGLPRGPIPGKPMRGGSVRITTLR